VGKQANYVLVPADKTNCGVCGSKLVDLLAPDYKGRKTGPGFFICRACGFVGQAGMGPVPHEGLRGGLLQEDRLNRVTVLTLTFEQGNCLAFRIKPPVPQAQVMFDLGANLGKWGAGLDVDLPEGNAELLILLSKLEWAQAHWSDDGTEAFRTCSVCGGPDRPDWRGPEGHLPGCELAAVLHPEKGG